MHVPDEYDRSIEKQHTVLGIDFQAQHDQACDNNCKVDPVQRGNKCPIISDET